MDEMAFAQIGKLYINTIHLQEMIVKLQTEGKAKDEKIALLTDSKKSPKKDKVDGPKNEGESAK